MTTATAIDPAKMDRLERINAAKAEDAAVKAAAKAGEPKPATPVLDYMNSADFNKRSKTTTRSSNGKSARAPKTPEGAVFYKDGKPLARHNLSFAAWSATKGIGGEGVARIGVVELKAVLAKAGVAEPETTSFSVKLPNGVVLAAEMPGSPLTAAQKAVPPKATAPAKKAPAKATSATKAPTKATTKKAAPAKAPAKKASPTKAAAPTRKSA